eukprot:CAMPEP_0196584294 /NCGR_PEP_ID=MMETSP1081-20130531/46552_1 /TAXON_ID=36882 /ORGANISM="Pyramimonas amylifera, Strain CCMP720" /LENGTH=55 /DNA_ID=CAMNT_0041905449 /DNA_START=152 /DNA_END=315 /DNA_ORIENTATION=+
MLSPFRDWEAVGPEQESLEEGLRMLHVSSMDLESARGAVEHLKFQAGPEQVKEYT